jgi:hypothetical protein
MRGATHSMYPEPLWGEIKSRLRSGDAAATEAAIVFLEADPWCFRSGYEKAELMKHLARVDLDGRDQERLRGVVVHVIQQPHRREFRCLVRLAASIWTPRLEADLGLLESAGSDEVREQVVRLRNRGAAR